MKKTTTRLLCLVVALVFALTGCAAKAPAANGTAGESPQTFNLQFATFWPAVDFQVVDGHMVWAKEISDRIKAETPHTVNITMQPGGVLLGATEIYEGVAAGAADIGSTCPVYTMGLFPLTMGLELPGYNNDNALVASMTMQKAFKTSAALQAEYDDVKVMFFWATGPGDFFTNDPVRKVADLAGKQIRAAGGSALAISALGGTPVNMPMSEAYLALDSGIVDGLLGPTDTLKGFRLAEVTKYITKTPFVGYNVVFVKVMNKDTWNKLPPSVQKIFDEVNEKYATEYGKLRTDNTILGQKFAVDEHKLEVIELDAAERENWLKAIMPIPEKWVKDTDAAGLPGTDTYKLYRELDEEFSKQYSNYGK